jgi:hypothetical protein
MNVVERCRHRFKERPLDQVKLRDLQLRIGKVYLYRHCMTCDHMVVLNAMRMKREIREKKTEPKKSGEFRLETEGPKLDWSLNEGGRKNIEEGWGTLEKEEKLMSFEKGKKDEELILIVKEECEGIEEEGEIKENNKLKKDEMGKDEENEGKEVKKKERKARGRKKIRKREENKKRKKKKEEKKNGEKLEDGDPRLHGSYPWNIWGGKIRRRKCGGCGKFFAKITCFDDRISDKPIISLCETCYKDIHYE